MLNRSLVTVTSSLARRSAASAVSASRSVFTAADCPFGDRAEKSKFCATSPITSEELIAKERRFAAHNYNPIPVVCAEAEGIMVRDPEGREYMDFLSAYSAVNQGHGHPRILKALTTQAKRMALSSRAFYNDMLPRFSEYINEYFGYDMVLPMNTGAEGVETAIKLARKWAYEKKGVPSKEAVVISALECFHGRTTLAISLSCDDEARDGFGPFVPNVRKIPYNDLKALEAVLDKEGSKVAAFIVEPIQGEAGAVVPDQGYLRGVQDLCKKHNVIMIADEIQTGLARTGKMLAVDYEDIRPDIVILGKALSGGMYPVSCVLADKDIMLCIEPGQHGSTYGGNPVGCAVAITALEVLRDENLAENAMIMGKKFRSEIELLAKETPYVTQVRGKGLLNAVVFSPEHGAPAWDLCMELKDNGLLAKPTHDNIVRLSPPLIINDAQMEDRKSVV